MTTAAGVPEGFAPLFRVSPLIDALGPFYARGRGAELVIGLCAAEKHTNSRGTVHGGVLATLGDIALGYAMAYSTDPPTPATTASLSIDYLASARIGDWIEARIERQRIGRRLAFANAYLSVGDKQVARVSAVFAVD